MTDDNDRIDNMVTRFLSWPLPRTFSPDCGISFDRRYLDEGNPVKAWPVGTNLLTAAEARQMIEHLIHDSLSIDKSAYVVDSSGELRTLFGESQKPEPSRLEIAAMMAACIVTEDEKSTSFHVIAAWCLDLADALIERERETRGTE